MRTTVDRMVSLVVGGRVLRRQPPVRIQYCNVPGWLEGPSTKCPNVGGCANPATACRRCGFYFCEDHWSNHIRRLPVPRDPWKTLLRGLRANAKKLGEQASGDTMFPSPTAEAPMWQTRVAGRTISDHAPIRIEWCNPPDTGKVDKPCVYPSKNCSGENSLCDRCGFGFCQAHRPGHIRRLALPRPMWGKIEESFVRQIDRAHEEGRRMIKVAVPAFPSKIR